MHHQIEDLQNNNVSLEDEMAHKDEDIHQLRLEQEELLEEIERKIYRKYFFDFYMILQVIFGILLKIFKKNTFLNFIRLREDNERLHMRPVQPVKRVYEVAVQCESRMCEKASQTRNPHYSQDRIKFVVRFCRSETIPL